MKNNIALVLTALLSLIIGFVLGNYYSSEEQIPRSVKDLKRELLYTELNSLDSLVTSDIKLDRKISYWRDETKYTLEGQIKNLSTMAVAKDISFQIDYLSETESIISSEKQIFYKYINPSDSLTISHPVYPPENTVSINFKIISIKGDSVLKKSEPSLF